MKKRASVAEFTKQFGPITNELAPGESLQVTSYGSGDEGLAGQVVTDPADG